MKRLMKAAICILAATISFSLIMIDVVSAEEYIAGENLTIAVTNATDGTVITDAICNITVSNSSGTQIDGLPMLNGADGSYFWIVSTIEDVLTEKYLAKANCSVAGAEWTTWAHFSVVDEYSINQTDNIESNLESSVIIYPTAMDTICPGETVIAEWRFYDLKANELPVVSWQDCNLTYYNDTGDKLHITNAFLIESSPGNEFIVAISAALTPVGNTSREYSITCEEVIITNSMGNNIPLELEQHFIFTEECNIAQRNVTQNLTASDIWTFPTRELTFYNYSAVNLTQDAFDIIQTHVWAAGTRTLTSFGTLIADIWAYATRTLTSFGTLVTDVWEYTDRNSTSVSITNVTQQEQLGNITGAVVTNIYDNSTLNVILPAEAI